MPRTKPKARPRREELDADVLVIGSGIAGLSLALHAAASASVLVVTKVGAEESNTNYAQGGIAAVLGDDDTISLHERDTLVCGAGLCDPAAVRVLVEEGPGEVLRLLANGVRFSRDPAQRGRLALGREGGHSRRRIVHAKDRTGHAVERTLLDLARAHPRIRVVENHIAVDLILESKHLEGTKRAVSRSARRISSIPSGARSPLPPSSSIVKRPGSSPLQSWAYWRIIRYRARPSLSSQLPGRDPGPIPTTMSLLLIAWR